MMNLPLAVVSLNIINMHPVSIFTKPKHEQHNLHIHVIFLFVWKTYTIKNTYHMFTMLHVPYFFFFISYSNATGLLEFTKGT